MVFRLECSTRIYAGVVPSCCSTPPPTYDGLDQETGAAPVSSLPARVRIGSHSSHHHIGVKYKDDAVSITDIRLESRSENKSSLSVESGSSGAGGHSSHSRGLAWTPPASVEGSTPTWTEGTPSFTESSSSGDMGCPTTPLRQGAHSSKVQHKKTVEHAINCLTTEMVSPKR
ncbi:hypothetical protein NQ315_009983 [Exocentrus adspersus]|uniref:Uncharacterized protein n=1 Tax=Exocentrus adspersus TaxID=1586481 RepID=A0AAV8WK13_9CUCU|nr:hypothetical protein NQ315_009983 [Exocentrus adspersus]